MGIISKIFSKLIPNRIKVWYEHKIVERNAIKTFHEMNKVTSAMVRELIYCTQSSDYYTLGNKISRVIDVYKTTITPMAESFYYQRKSFIRTYITLEKLVNY